MPNKNIYKEKIINFNNFLYSKFPEHEHISAELFPLEDISNLGNVKLRGFYSHHYLNLDISDDKASKRCSGSVGDDFVLVNLKTYSSLKTRISGQVKRNDKRVKKIKLESNFNSLIVNELKIYEKITQGNINKDILFLRCQSKFLHRQGILSRSFLGKLNASDIVINITDLGQTSQNKTLLTGTVIKGDIAQSFNISALWQNGAGYIQQIEGFLLPILIYPLV